MKKTLTILASALLIGISVAATRGVVTDAPAAPQAAVDTAQPSVPTHSQAPISKLPEEGDGNYIYQLSDGSAVAFRLQDLDDGDQIKGTYALVTHIANASEEMEIPSTVTTGGKEYEVIAVGMWRIDDCETGEGERSYWEYFYESANNLKKLIIPECAVFVEIGYSYELETIYAYGPTKRKFKVSDYWGRGLRDIHVDNADAHRSYYDRYGIIAISDYALNWVTINVTEPGTWAEEYIKIAGEDWSALEAMRVVGDINSVDLEHMKYLEYIEAVDLSETQITTIPSNFLRNASNTLRTVILPKTVHTIQGSAFYNYSLLCNINLQHVKSVEDNAFQGTNIEEVEFQDIECIRYAAFNGCKSLKSLVFNTHHQNIIIDNLAFQGNALQEIDLPEGLSALGDFVFNGCDNLKNVKFPSTLKNIPAAVFSGCGIEELDIPEGIISISTHAFFSNHNLKTVHLPSTLKTLGGDPFGGCDSITTVTCAAIWPPETAGNDLFTAINTFKARLYVLPFAKKYYRNTEGWLNFLFLDELWIKVPRIFVELPIDLEMSAKYEELLSNKPKVTLDNDGQLTLNGDAVFSTSLFETNTTSRFRNNTDQTDGNTTLVNNLSNLRADNVVTHLTLSDQYNWENNWHFVSFPYDVKISDITTDPDTYWVVRGYDGEARANGSGEGTYIPVGSQFFIQTAWVNLPADGVLKANQGYIISAHNPIDGGWTTHFDVPAINNSNKNRIFSNTDVSVELKEYPSRDAENRSWNFIGNPYPAFYELRTIKDFTGPVILWRGGNYEAYSPLDDDIILYPNEAFFLQAPAFGKKLTFAAEGRLHRFEADSLHRLAYNGLRAPEVGNPEGRNIFNFTISDGNHTDRTRIVLNPAAELGYEVCVDAPKFFADCGMTEIYTVSGDVQYSINERPLADGAASIAINAVPGRYTLHLDGKYSREYTVVLTDLLTGRVTVLNDDDYTFSVTDAYCGTRFSVSFETSISGIESVRQEIDADTEVTVTAVNGVEVYRGSMSAFRASTPGVYVITANGKSRKAYVRL